jgi:hypothetical protein
MGEGKGLVGMSEYRVEYSETGIPGILYKYPENIGELYAALTALYIVTLKYSNVKVYRN